MAKNAFDQKFGTEFLASIPPTPGVYLVYTAENHLIYIGKAKNLRRRLSQYRNARRRRKHRKMRKIVGSADRIEIRRADSDLEALILETRLIQEHRPKLNVEGAFYFLYPLIGMTREGDVFKLCYTTMPASLPEFTYYGAFRSRFFTGEAFFALIHLLGFVGHPNRIVKSGPRPKYSYVYAFRNIPRHWDAAWSDFWHGTSREALELLILALVENADARNAPKQIQDGIDALGRFWENEAVLLAKMRTLLEYPHYPVPQIERDLLFLKYRHARADAIS